MTTYGPFTRRCDNGRAIDCSNFISEERGACGPLSDGQGVFCTRIYTSARTCVLRCALLDITHGLGASSNECWQRGRLIQENTKALWWCAVVRGGQVVQIPYTCDGRSLTDGSV